MKSELFVYFSTQPVIMDDIGQMSGQQVYLSVQQQRLNYCLLSCRVSVMSEDDGVEVREEEEESGRGALLIFPSVIISELWVGCNAFQLTRSSLLHHTQRGESPIVTMDSLHSSLPPSILVFSSLNVYNEGFRSLFILNIRYTFFYAVESSLHRIHRITIRLQEMTALSRLVTRQLCSVSCPLKGARFQPISLLCSW